MEAETPCCDDRPDLLQQLAGWFRRQRGHVVPQRAADIVAGRVVPTDSRRAAAAEGAGRCWPRVAVLLMPALLLSAARPAWAQNGWIVEVAGGFALNVPTRLTIRQAGQPDISLTAHYDGRSFASPLYYAVRIGRWARGRGWEVELIHHKLYLQNPPSEVQQFDVSHGFNLVSVNRAIAIGGTIVRPGVGLVLTHPENVVRGQALSQSRGLLGWGYYLSGPMAQLAVARRFHAWDRLFIAAEGKVTAAYARVPVQEGSATLSNVAFHGLLGVGYGW